MLRLHPEGESESVAELLLVDERADESALLYIAVSLRRPGTSIAELRQLGAVEAFLAEARARGRALPRLIIAGRQALLALAYRDVPPVWAAEIPVVGFAASLDLADAERMSSAGVREIHVRPLEWRPYCEAVAAILGRWLSRAP